MRKLSLLASMGAVIALMLVGLGANASTANSRTQVAAASNSNRLRTFVVEVKNESGMHTLKTSAGRVPVPISPGAWAVYAPPNPLFTRGRMADTGTQRIAEDGFPMVKASQLEGIGRVRSSGIFTEEGGPLGPAFEPGTRTRFKIRARPGDWFQFEAMFVQSNDYFYALGGDGIPLFDPKGKPISGNVTHFVNIWDAGTEVDEEPGNGTFAKPNQAPQAQDVGPDTREPVDPQFVTGDPWHLPSVRNLIGVKITPR